MERGTIYISGGIVRFWYVAVHGRSGKPWETTPKLILYGIEGENYLEFSSTVI